MDVLALTTNADAPFFTQQVDALADRGISVQPAPVGGTVGPATDRSPIEYLRFFRTVRDRAAGVDLVHAHYGLTAPMALAQRQRPVVLSLWGSDVLGTVGVLSGCCARLCDEVVVMSPVMARRLGRPCHVIPDGVDLDRFTPMARDAAREAVGWPATVRNVLFPYTPARTVKDYPRAKRLVEAAAARLDAPVALRTVSGVDHSQMPAYLNAADALLLTSEHEGSPNSVKEALACNLPVVATDVGDVRERLVGVEPSTVADDDSALVDGLVSILRNGVRSDGRVAAREVSLERTTDALVAVYKRAAAPESGQRSQASQSRPISVRGRRLPEDDRTS